MSDGETVDVVLIGSGVMSANLGALVKKVGPELKVHLYEATEELAQESSNAWNNAGTGHAGICELSYTPFRKADGSVDVSKAIEIFEQFELTRQFWGYAVASGMIERPRDFINAVPHVSFVYGQEQVDFLKDRHQSLVKHHFFQGMEYTTDRAVIAKWAPLLVEGRENVPVAATRMESGTDVNFGEIARKLIGWLGKQPGCTVAASHRVVGLKRIPQGWRVSVKDLKQGRTFDVQAKFVFIGAGGGSLPLLQKSGIAEGKGFGGFPVGGQWLVCDKPEIVDRHHAKVYGQAQAEAPTMAVPHLDRRVIDGKTALLFGPFAAWTTKFLQGQGSVADLPFSVRLHNIGPLLKVGMHNIPLVRYLVQQGTQSMADRMRVLHGFYPNARREDWRLIDAGIRVQAIKNTNGEAGIVHFGTEIVTDADCTISALLGASPGASVSVALMVDVLKGGLGRLLKSPAAQAALKEILPSHNEPLRSPALADRYREVSRTATQALQL